MTGFINSDRQYGDMNAGAHRQAAPLAGTPGLVWHQSFWRPDRERQTDLSVERAKAADKQPPEDPYDYWREDIDRFLYNFYLTLLSRRISETDLPICHNIDDGHLSLFRHRVQVEKVKAGSAGWAEPTLMPFDGILIRHDVFSCRMNIGGVKFTFHAALFTEFWSFTIFGDFSNFVASEDEPQRAIGDDALSAIGAKLAYMSDFIASRYEHLTGDYPEDDELYETTIEAFEAYWRKFFRSMVEETKFLKDHRAPITQNRFGNFFGVILAVRPQKDVPSKPFSSLNSPTKPRDTWQAANLRRPKKVSIANKLDGKELKDPLHMVHAVWPIVRRLHGGAGNSFQDIEKKQGKPEYTATLLQDKRVLYISALGRAASAEILSSANPVIYTVVSTHTGRWQTGRLLDRLHELGMLRLAATRDLEALIQTGDKLEAIAATFNDDEKFDLTDAKRELAKAESWVVDGLAYRLGRSRSYIARFGLLVRQLRTTRVEGFQIYDEFVQRRVGDRFHLIHQTTELYERIKHEITRRSNLQLQESIEKQTDRANRLLATAELIIIAPLAYYIGYILYSIAGDLLIEFGQFNATISKQFCFVVSTLVVGVIYLLRLFGGHAEPRQ